MIYVPAADFPDVVEHPFFARQFGEFVPTYACFYGFHDLVLPRVIFNEL